VGQPTTLSLQTRIEFDLGCYNCVFHTGPIADAGTNDKKVLTFYSFTLTLKILQFKLIKTIISVQTIISKRSRGRTLRKLIVIWLDDGSHHSTHSSYANKMITFSVSVGIMVKLCAWLV
jgi:hypothetical protein